MILLIVIIITLLGFVAKANHICDILESFMVVIGGPFFFISKFCWGALMKSWTILKHALTSAGISGNHWIQRFVGAIMISIVSLLGVTVGVLNLIIPIEGLFGIETDSILESLPISIEILTAIELAAAGFIFGFLLLDILGITHVLKFYTKEHLTPRMRSTFTILFLLGTIYSIYLFAVSGVIRIETVHVAEDVASEQLDISDLQIESVTADSLDQVPNLELPYNFDQGTDTMGSEGYMKASNKLLIGIPIVSITSGILAGVALIPAFALLILIPLFLCVSLLLGIILIVSVITSQTIYLATDFLCCCTINFEEIGESIRQKRNEKNNHRNSTGSHHAFTSEFKANNGDNNYYNRSGEMN
jgi:hypothetical protein